MRLRREITLTILVVVISGVVAAVGLAQEVAFIDGRLDVAPAATVITYCRTIDDLGGIEAYLATGGEAFAVTREQVERGMARAVQTRTVVQIAAGRGGTQLLVYPDRVIRVTAADGYSFNLTTNNCGGFSPDYTGEVRVLVDAVDVLLQEAAAEDDASESSDSGTTQIVIAGDAQTHVVRAGENLFRIGLRYGVPFTEIARANGLSDVDSIFVGQVLVIPDA